VTGAPQGSYGTAETMQEEGTPTPEAAAPEEKAASKNAVLKKDRDKPVAAEEISNPVLWQTPGDITAKDMFYGQGGEQRQPQPPFTFLREDRQGTNPKFDCRDANHKTWRVKLGQEARPEVVASRLLWAVGYFADDDYVVPRAQIRGLKMKRKSPQQTGTEVIDARFARKAGGEHKVGTWRWRENPFFGTREFNGLRVMMAVLNNWDLKDINNAVLQDSKTGQQVFFVSDTGASFGSNAFNLSQKKSKGNAGSYEKSKFVVRNDGTAVDFATPSVSVDLITKTVGFGAMAFMAREHLDWIGKNIPAPDAHWIGTLLGQLSHQQLVDAFRAANFSPNEIDSYVTVLEDRIHELQGI
jgi:hypothetical protein